MDQSDSITINGIEIHQAVVGSGHPVLMVHGWGADMELLRPLARQLASYNYRLYLLDLPGFGASEPPREPCSIFDYANICRAFLDYHKIDSAHYFGHSLGGRIGLILASDHAQRIRSMVLSNSAGIRARLPVQLRLRQQLYKAIRQGLLNLGARKTAERLRESYSRRYASSDYQTASPVMRQTLVNVVNQDLLAKARQVAVPTVLVWGDKDEDTPLWMGQKLEQTIPDAALIVFEGAGHYAYLDYPQKTASIMHALFKADDADAKA